MSEGTHTLTEDLATLFGPGSCAGRTDGELLERFRTCRDDAGQRAFESLVTRHGPMVLAICRHVLDDPIDVHDAFQAVFLVLARRAGAIRKNESVGSWLYGVTVRVAARARAAAVRRRIRERRVREAASAAALVGGRAGDGSGDPVEHDDSAVAIQQEVVRLPERYRQPIVLCYFQGLTHDEAAARLNWPVGTVRSRLARARDRLRTRLTRRGIADPSPSTAPATTLPVPVPVLLARAAVRLATGQPAAVGSWSSASMALADGVLQTMMMKKLTIAVCVIASIAVGGGMGALVVRRARGQHSPAPEAATRRTDPPAAATKAEKPPEVPPLLRELIEAARERLKAQQAFYEEGRITINRFIQGSAELQRVELLAARTEAERTAIRRRHVNRLKEIERRERAELQVGRGTVADLAEARQGRLEAEFDMGRSEKDDAERAALLRRIAELERKVEQLQKERGNPAPGRPRSLEPVPKDASPGLTGAGSPR